MLDLLQHMVLNLIFALKSNNIMVFGINNFSYKTTFVKIHDVRKWLAGFFWNKNIFFSVSRVCKSLLSCLIMYLYMKILPEF